MLFRIFGLEFLKTKTCTCTYCVLFLLVSISIKFLTVGFINMSKNCRKVYPYYSHPLLMVSSALLHAFLQIASFVHFIMHNFFSFYKSFLYSYFYPVSNIIHFSSCPSLRKMERKIASTLAFNENVIVLIRKPFFLKKIRDKSCFVIHLFFVWNYL